MPLSQGNGMGDRSTRQAALISATLASFLTPFMGSSINVAMPELGRTFSMDAVMLGWVPTSYLLATAMLLVPFGRIADLIGRKRIFTYGILVYVLGSLCSGLAPSGSLLVASRVIQGTGGAMMFGTGVAILTSVFPPAERGRVLGLNVAAVYTGLSVGPFVGGVLTQHLGWRSLFLINVPLGLIVVAFVALRLRGEWAEARGESFDLTGSVIYAVALLALMFGFSLLPEPTGAGLVLAGMIGLAAFAWWENRTKHPVLSIDLFIRNRLFALSNLAAMINYAATSAVTFLLSLYLQHIKALTPQQAGLVLIAQPIVQATLSPVAGRLSDRVEPRLVASTGMTLTAIGLGLLVLLSPATPIWAVVLRLVLLGAGFALFSSPNMNAIIGSVERRLYGVASGMAATMRLVGQMLSMGIAMLLFALYIGRVEISPETYPQLMTSARAAFAVFMALCIGGVLASLSRGRIRRTDDGTRP